MREPNKAMEPTGLSFATHRDPLWAGGSSPTRQTDQITAMRLVVAAVLITVAVDTAVAGPRRPQCAIDGGDPCKLYAASMIELIATPEVFDGKRVRTFGYIHFEFEGDAIYLHKEDQLRSLHSNGLWVELAQGVSRTDCQDTHVLVEGTFRSGNRGHMGLWSGAIVEITRCVPWR